MSERHRFDVIDQEQLAAQIVAVMDAHFQRPTVEEKQHVLKLASMQLFVPNDDAQSSGATQSQASGQPDHSS